MISVWSQTSCSASESRSSLHSVDSWTDLYESLQLFEQNLTQREREKKQEKTKSCLVAVEDHCIFLQFLPISALSSTKRAEILVNHETSRLGNYYISLNRLFVRFIYVPWLQKKVWETQSNSSVNVVLSAPSGEDVKKAQALKEEGNALVKKGEHRKAIEKYSQSLKHNPTEVTTFTNRCCLHSLLQWCVFKWSEHTDISVLCVSHKVLRQRLFFSGVSIREFLRMAFDTRSRPASLSGLKD